MPRFNASPSILIRIALLGVALLLAIWSACAGIGLAQWNEAHRIDRKVERLQRDQEQMGVDIERRFGALAADIKVIQSDVAAVKSELARMTNLGLGVIGAVGLLILQSMWALIAGRRNSQLKEH